MSKQQIATAIVTNLWSVTGGKERYVVCGRGENTNLPSITFTLLPSIWNEKLEPHEGDFVLLSDIRETGGGSRALHARFASSDERARFLAEQEERRGKYLSKNWQSQFVIQRPRLFRTDHAGVWHDWLHSQHMWYEPLRSLYADERVPLGIRARALVVAFSPDLSECPIEWVGDRAVGESFADGRWEANLEPISDNQELLQLVHDFVNPFFLEFHQQILKHSAGNYRVTNEAKRRWRFLSRIYIELFAFLSGTPRYILEEMKLTEPWQNHDDRFSQLQLLLAHKYVSDQRKAEADTIAREMAISDLVGESTKARGAFQNYCLMVEDLVNQREQPGSKLLLSQLRFIYGLIQTHPKHACTRWDSTTTFLWLALTHSDKSLASQIAEEFVTRQNFKIGDWNESAMANRILEQNLLPYPLESKVKQAIADYEEREQKEKNVTQKNKDRVMSVIDRMIEMKTK